MIDKNITNDIPQEFHILYKLLEQVLTSYLNLKKIAFTNIPNKTYTHV